MLELCSAQFGQVQNNTQDGISFKTNINFAVRIRGESSLRLPIEISLKSFDKIAKIEIFADHTKVYILSLGSWITFLIFFWFFDLIFFGFFFGAILASMIYIPINKGVSKRLNEFGGALLSRRTHRGMER